MIKLKRTFLIFIIFLGSVFFFWNDILDLHSKIFLRLPQIEKELTTALTEKIGGKIITSTPLEIQEKAPETFLTKDGVIEWTNIQRSKQ